MRFAKMMTVFWVGVVVLVPVAGWGLGASNVSQHTLLEADQGKFHLWGGISWDVENGEMAYTIRGREEGGWKSELAWPLERISYFGGSLSASFGNRWQCNLGVWKNIADSAGTMQDSDWFTSISGLLYSLYGSDKAIYGEFDATVDALQTDFNLRYDLLRGAAVAFGPMLGYAYKRWQWTTGDGYQRSPLPLYNVGYVTGTGITYEEKIRVPYLGVAFSFLPQDSIVGVNLSMRYSPLAQCDDNDNHLRRYKESTGTTKGTFFALGSDIRWTFRNSWSLTGKMDYETYDLQGEQQQYFYGGTDPAPGTRYTDIDMTVTGHQFSFGLMLGYAF